jgi:hypothetical protein
VKLLEPCDAAVPGQHRKDKFVDRVHIRGHPGKVRSLVTFDAAGSCSRVLPHVPSRIPAIRVMIGVCHHSPLILKFNGIDIAAAVDRWESIPAPSGTLQDGLPIASIVESVLLLLNCKAGQV